MSNTAKIITLPNTHLRKPSREISAPSDHCSRICRSMERATIKWENGRKHEVGVALAAVQVDIHEKIIIIRNDFEDKSDQSFTPYINPKIVSTSGNLVLDYEGCLSVTDIYGLVPRHESVTVEALTEKGKNISLEAHGFLARVLQHEIDHTEGKLFIDHIKDQDSFFHLNEDGQLIKLDHADILASSILW